MDSVNFDRAADYYDETRGFPDGVAPKVGAYISDKLNLTRDMNLLEVGIGTGRIALPLTPYIGTITGLDISTKMLEKIRHKPGSEAIQVSIADAHMLPFVENSFDIAYITHVLHLVADPIRVLNELERVVKSSGHFVHMRSRYFNSGDMQKIVDAWNTATPQRPKGVKRWNQMDEVVTQANWKLQEEFQFTYPYISKVANFLEPIEQRMWSSTWFLDDDVMKAGLEAVYSAIDGYLDGDRNAERQAEGIFQIRVYSPS